MHTVRFVRLVCIWSEQYCSESKPLFLGNICMSKQFQKKELERHVNFLLDGCINLSYIMAFTASLQTKRGLKSMLITFSS